eukprot:SAG11_NODE_130_length_15497_cov_10.780556_13_plen_57_part_00
MSALTVQVLRLSLSLGSVTAVNLRRSVALLSDRHVNDSKLRGRQLWGAVAHHNVSV